MQCELRAEVDQDDRIRVAQGNHPLRVRVAYQDARRVDDLTHVQDVEPEHRREEDSGMVAEVFDLPYRNEPRPAEDALSVP